MRSVDELEVRPPSGPFLGREDATITVPDVVGTVGLGVRVAVVERCRDARRCCSGWTNASLFSINQAEDLHGAHEFLGVGLRRGCGSGFRRSVMCRLLWDW
jgi:hypothetical protein